MSVHMSDLTDTPSEDMRAATREELMTLVHKSPVIGARIVESAARHGVLAAQIAWASLLAEGDSVRQDLKAARDWFSAAAEQNDAEALFRLGQCHEQGLGGAKNAQRAADLYRKSARMNFTSAQYALGQLLLAGTPTPQKQREGMGWHLVAAKGGHVGSMVIIGDLCERGHGVPQSVENALGWYRKATDADHVWGQFNLARLLADRGQIDEAALWFRSAAIKGDEPFRKQLEEALQERKEEPLRAVASALRNGLIDGAAPAENRLSLKRGRGWLGIFIVALMG